MHFSNPLHSPNMTGPADLHRSYGAVRCLCNIFRTFFHLIVRTHGICSAVLYSVHILYTHSFPCGSRTHVTFFLLFFLFSVPHLVSPALLLYFYSLFMQFIAILCINIIFINLLLHNYKMWCIVCFSSQERYIKQERFRFCIGSGTRIKIHFRRHLQ